MISIINAKSKLLNSHLLPVRKEYTWGEYVGRFILLTSSNTVT